MIRFIFDLKIGTGEDFYLVSKNERIDQDVELENFSSMNQEELARYLLDLLDMTHDYVEDFFSDSLIHDKSFIDKVDILDISNVRIKKIGKSSNRSSSMKAAEFAPSSTRSTRLTTRSISSYGIFSPPILLYAS